MNTELRLLKMVDGEPHHVRLVIDSERFIVEGPDILGPVRTPSSIQSPRDAALAARGIQFHKDAEGRVIVDSVPELEKEILSFFSQRPCWFPECEALRAKYKAEVEAAGGAGCTACDHGAIIRKYRPLIEKALSAAQNIQPAP